MKTILKLLLLTTFLFKFSVTLSAPIPANKAFQLTATAKDYQTILLQWKIAPDYYLYKKRFYFKVIKPKNVFLAPPLYPANDQTLKTALGNYQVYANNLIVPIPIIDAMQKNVMLQVCYQGCSKAGYCYPPTSKIVSVNLARNYMQWAKPLAIDIAPIKKTVISAKKTPENPVIKLLKGKSLWALLIGFLGFGILVSLTPCVLPMIPILSSMIIGQKKISHSHAFLLSVFYVFGMAITYAIAGVIFGALGSSVQVSFQQPWIIALFSLLFVAMALSLFGAYQIQLPEKLRNKIANISNHQKKGSYFGAAAMGCLSTLILSPCATPPLIAVLGFISQTGSALLGASALFIMSIGMGLPLLLIGAIGPKVLPRAGMWMNLIKNIMGLLLLGVAIFLVQRILPDMIGMLLWAALSLGTGLYFGALSSATSFGALIKKAIGLLFIIYGVLLVSSAYQGNTNPLYPLPKKVTGTQQKVAFDVLDSLPAVKKAIKAAPANQIVMIDFYANWCIACKELDTITFSNLAVQKKLSSMTLIRADITANSSVTKQLQQHFNVIAPPTLLFFKNGKEIKGMRTIGFIEPKILLEKLTG